MKIQKMIALVALSVAAAIACAQGSVKAWQKEYDKAEKAFERLDIKQIMSWMAPDATMTSMGKTETKAQAEASMKQWFAMMKNLKCDFKVTSVKEKGDMAMVVAKTKMMGMMKPMGNDKKAHMMGSAATETFTWRKMKGKWMITRIVTTDEKMTMDGKPYKPG